jgi:uncharacterized secreted protein with C-terminal beta-propeller domain
MKILLATFSLNALRAIFLNDAHYIVSERGWEILNQNIKKHENNSIQHYSSSDQWPTS